jgi:hypothetical protein
MNQFEAIKEVERLLTQTLADHPHAVEPLAFAIRRLSPDIVGVLMNLRLADQQQAPFPMLDDIVAAQCTVFDNWPKGTKPKTVNGKREPGARAERYKATVEVWTELPKSDKLSLTKGNAAFVGTAHLLDGNRLARKVERMVLKDDSEPMLAFAKDMLQPVADDGHLRCGPMLTMGNGTHAHMGTFVTADGRALHGRSGLSVTVRSPSGTFAFTDWATTYSNGGALKGNAIMTSRWSRLPQKEWWTTTEKVAA